MSPLLSFWRLFKKLPKKVGCHLKRVGGLPPQCQAKQGWIHWCENDTRKIHFFDFTYLLFFWFSAASPRVGYRCLDAVAPGLPGVESVSKHCKQTNKKVVFRYFAFYFLTKKNVKKHSSNNLPNPAILTKGAKLNFWRKKMEIIFKSLKKNWKLEFFLCKVSVSLHYTSGGGAAASERRWSSRFRNWCVKTCNQGNKFDFCPRNCRWSSSRRGRIECNKIKKMSTWKWITF